MPTTYAHWRFGDKCLKTLPDEIQKIVNNNRDIYNYGVHGPDFLFYYNCIKHNGINTFGSNLHKIPFNETLKKWREIYLNAEDKDAALAYLLGFLCHFALDSYCHGYIDATAETGLVSHGKIESQLDRYFMLKDNLNPLKHKTTDTLKPNKKMAKDISQFFPELSEKVIYQSLKDQKFYLLLLRDGNKTKRKILEKTMDLTKTSSFKELLLTDSNDKRCKATNERLNKYFDKAVEHYPLLAKSLIAYLEKNKPLIPYFQNHFCPKPDYKSIPILSYEDELAYKVKEFQK